ncbi:hypothetical protein DPMN_121448 [Dreissena polymorpha]|uniref:Uncharacterized protein n=1 Tax=Dreissena polymorpha TaxID=45954 RepID=A0A9D4GQR7_DREPO|nr:hypothetical protein DPMN_121448 [Dreissena polymorpha]
MSDFVDGGKFDIVWDGLKEEVVMSEEDFVNQSQQTIYMGPIWVPCGHLYGPHVGCQHGTQMGSATGLHMGPIWAAP